MANIKFSQFTADGPIDGSTIIPKTGSENSFLVGYNDTENTNNQWTLPQIAEGLSAHIPTIYTGDSNITSNRTIGLLSSNYLKIQDSSNVDLFSIAEDGTFALGKGVTNSSSSNVAIGDGVTTSSVFGVGIGRLVNIGAAASYSTVIGNQAATTSAQNVVIGAYSAAGFKGTSVGYGASGSGNYAVNLGHDADGSAARSVTINASSGTAAPSTEFEFGVYMTSNTTPDFKVVGGGESVLNTSLQITGQGYSSIQTGVSINSNINFDQGNVQEVTLVASTTTDFDPINFKAGATYILKLIQPSGGNGLIDWESAGGIVNWPGGTPPTLSTAAGAVDIVTLICTDASTTLGTYYANATLNFS